MVDEPVLTEYRNMLHDLHRWVGEIPRMREEDLLFEAGSWQVRISDLLQEDEDEDRDTR